MGAILATATLRTVSRTTAIYNLHIVLNHATHLLPGSNGHHRVDDIRTKKDLPLVCRVGIGKRSLWV